MPAHHDVRSSDVFTRRLHRTLAAAAERGPADFPDLPLTPGMGAHTIRSLAMVAEVIPAPLSLSGSGEVFACARRQGPACLPCPDQGLRRNHPRHEVGSPERKLGREEEVQALKRPDDQARRLERTADEPSFEAFVATERAAALDGRCVFGWEKDLMPPRTARLGGK
ncbi:MAG: hypothetical protein JWQ17_643 [Tardiphaga sp.]|nr:hypothetical protein [Tardiphaga sp.]